MSIYYNSNTKEFHLCNEHISYIINVLENNHIGQLYYGKAIKHRDSFEHLLELGRRDMAPCTFEGNSKFSLEHIKQEYPTFGSGDMRYPAYEIEQSNGSHTANFQYKKHKIYKGKPKLNGLPATYVESEDEATTLEILLEDLLINTEMVLTYTMYENLPVITRNTSFHCINEEGITLISALSMCVDLPDSDYEMIDLTGAWGRERNIETHKLHQGLQGIYSMRGHSSHQFNPFLALKRWNTDEFTGEALGFSLVYSGNFLAQVEVDTFHVSRVLMGINPNEFRWHLDKGETFQTPEVVMVYSNLGLNKMSQTFHELYRTRLVRGYWRDRIRPILINNWEATYMKFNEEKIVSIAETAKSLGVELFVLDDGWFGKRNDDTTSLGDWYPNKEKLPNGIVGVAKKINDLGLMFGLWFEPEMISKNSDLYEKHPDWIFGDPNRNICHSRNQYVLDLSKDEVVDYIYNVISKILREAPISYVKWDMNRGLSEVYSIGNDSVYQGKSIHRYILGVYKLYERLTSEFPKVLFESCASGGARFDPGMLFYAPQGWTSDNTDAMDRLKIQYGSSMVYPICSMGSHVSAIPNHQTFRNTPLETRANVAYFGTFGYELDLNKISYDEQQVIKKQIEFMKEHREFILHGTFYRLISPFDNNVTSWMIVSKNRKKAITGYYRHSQPVNCGYERIRLKGLIEDVKYSISDRETIYYGDELMSVGLIVSDTPCGNYTPDIYEGDYQSRIFVIEAIRVRRDELEE